VALLALLLIQGAALGEDLVLLHHFGADRLVHGVGLSDFRQDVDGRVNPLLDIFGVRLLDLAQVLDFSWVLYNRAQLGGELCLLNLLNLRLREDVILGDFIKLLALLVDVDRDGSLHAFVVNLLRHLTELFEEILGVGFLIVLRVLFLQENFLDLLCDFILDCLLRLVLFFEEKRPFLVDQISLQEFELLLLLLHWHFFTLRDILSFLVDDLGLGRSGNGLGLFAFGDDTEHVLLLLGFLRTDDHSRKLVLESLVHWRELWLLRRLVGCLELTFWGDDGRKYLVRFKSGGCHV